MVTRRGAGGGARATGDAPPRGRLNDEELLLARRVGRLEDAQENVEKKTPISNLRWSLKKPG